MIFSTFSPVVALFMRDVPQFNSKKAVIFFQSLVFALFLCMLLLFPEIPSKTVPSLLAFYPLSLFSFNLIFLKKFKIHNFSRILSVSIMLSYVLTEIHEIPAFLFGISQLNSLDPKILIIIIPPVYALLVFGIAAKSFRLSLSIKEKTLIVMALLALFVFYMINPLIDINETPTVWAYLKRLYCFAILAAVFYLRGNPGGSADG